MVMKLAKIRVNHTDIRARLGLPEDVEITSMYTQRRGSSTRDSFTYIYLKSERFNEIDEGLTAPEISMRDARNNGMWDEENNE